MAQIIEMPKLSDTMEDGGVAEWFKKEGEEVEEGEPLVAIETDKATIEYASPLDGTLLKILVSSGKRVALKEPIAVFGEKGESFKLEELINKESTATENKESTATENKVLTLKPVELKPHRLLKKLQKIKILILVI
jgi:pyruvate dehydrogenase E2 component (dihydrolipoamide acetyltransferase)